MVVAWEAALAHFGGSQTESGHELLVEQRLWIAYKERAANVYCLPGNGREPCVLARNLAKAKIITERTEQLKSYLTNGY